MVAVKKDALTGTITPRHSSAEVWRTAGRPGPQAADEVAIKNGTFRDDRTARRRGPAEVLKNSRQPENQADGVASTGVVGSDGSRRARRRAPSTAAPTSSPAGEETTNAAAAARRKERKGRVCLDDLFKKANRLSQLHKPHKANDAGWEAIERIRARDGELGLNHFKLLKRLGCGDIGSVYLAELRDTKFRFAMKVMDLGSLASRRKQVRAETERDILSILGHPFLPTLYAHFETPQFLCLVMEFCSGGDLHTLRQKQVGRFFTVKSARFYAAEILLALEYLHMMGVVYRDLKPENVLVRGDGHVMLSDFDLSLKCPVSPTLLTHSVSVAVRSSRDEKDDTRDSYQSTFCLPRNITSRNRKPSLTSATSTARRPLDISGLKFADKPPSSKWKPRLSKSSSKSKSSSNVEQVVPLPELVAEPTGVRSMSFVGTHEYLAPEIIAGDGHGSPVDWWTFGIFLFELLYGTTPFKGDENETTLVNVLTHPLEFPEKSDPYYHDVESSAQELIKALLVKDPQKRLGFNRGATEIKQHPFFEGINWALIRCTLPPQIPRPSTQNQKPPEKRQDGLLPPSKLASVVPPPAQEQESNFDDMKGESKDPGSSLHFEYF